MINIAHSLTVPQYDGPKGPAAVLLHVIAQVRPGRVDLHVAAQTDDIIASQQQRKSTSS